MDGRIQELRARLQGPVACIGTSFTREGDIAWGGIRQQIDTAIAGGCGTTLLTFGSSQFDFLSDREVGAVTQVLVEQTAGRAMTVAATKRWWTGQAVEFATYCRDLGADMLMMLPSEHAKSVEGKAAWYKAAAAVIPVMLVGYPDHAILNLLLDAPRICAFKEDGTMEYALDTMVKYAGRWEFMSGGGFQRHLTQWPYGCKSYMSWTAGFAPHIDHQYWRALQENDQAAAVQVVTQVEVPLFALMAKFPESFEDIWRGLLELNGTAPRYLRPPRRSLTDADLAIVAEASAKAGLLRQAR